MNWPFGREPQSASSSGSQDLLLTSPLNMTEYLAYLTRKCHI